MAAFSSNPFDENYQNPVNNSMRSINSIFDATDILIGDSDVCFKPETDQMSFFSRHGNQNSALLSAPSTSNYSLEFGSSSSKSFPSPPLKRFCFDRTESFFNKSNAEQSTATESSINQTKDIFNMNFSKNKARQSASLFSEDSSNNMMFRLSDSDAFSSASSEDEMTFTGSSKQEVSSFFRESKDEFMDQSDTNFNDEKENAAKNKSRKVNTFYQAHHLLDTEKIDKFYEKHNSIDWKSGKNIDLKNIMEPSIDYVVHRMKCLKPLTTGRKEDIINCDGENASNCGTINQSIEEIEDSFDKGNFICSTPEEPENSDGNGGTNPLDIAFMEALQSSSPREDQDDDEDRTRSFLVDKESENVWSAITHVSCSIPLNEQESEPIFDITTLFDYSYDDDLENDKMKEFKCLDNDSTRYELLLSILNDCNPLDNTTTEMQETLK